MHLRLPALRERPADILELADAFREEICRGERPAGPLAFGGGQSALLTKNPWPGNVRELENTLHRAVLLAVGTEIDADAIMTPEGDAISATPHPIRRLARPRPRRP